MNISNVQLLAYKLLPGIGNAALLSMIKFMSENDTVLLSNKDMYDFLIDCIKGGIIKRIKSDSVTLSVIEYVCHEAETIMRKSEELGINSVSICDEDFPANLKTIFDDKGNNKAPVLLFYKGNIKNIINKKGVAIIGTRHPSDEGIKAGKFFAEKYAGIGFNIISGLAIGCDAAAHIGALNVNGTTTAFVAHGLDIDVYPSENKNLAKRIADNGGLIMSEYALGTLPVTSNFIERDRLQSGLADATLLIQSDINGGSMHAVNYTLSNKKPLYAVVYKNQSTNEMGIVKGNIFLINERKAQKMNSSLFMHSVETIKNNTR